MKLFLRDKVPSNYNRATWLDIVSQVERQVNDLSEGRVSAYHGKATAAPTIGEWVRGDWVKNSLPSSSGLFGWICTESGSPGTWLGFGLIEPFGSGGGIALPIGAQNVTFSQSGNGTIAETVHSKLDRELRSVFSWFSEAAKSDVLSYTGSTDVSAAFQNALDYASTNPCRLTMPPGRYRLNSGLIWHAGGSQMNSVLEGLAGAQGVQIYYHGTGGIAITVRDAVRYHARNFGIYDQGTGVTALKLMSTSAGSNHGPATYENIFIREFDEGIRGGDSDDKAASEIQFKNLECVLCTVGVVVEEENTLNWALDGPRFGSCTTGLKIVGQGGATLNQCVVNVRDYAASNVTTDFDVDAPAILNVFGGYSEGNVTGHRVLTTGAAGVGATQVAPCIVNFFGFFDSNGGAVENCLLHQPGIYTFIGCKLDQGISCGGQTGAQNNKSTLVIDNCIVEDGTPVERVGGITDIWRVKMRAVHAANTDARAVYDDEEWIWDSSGAKITLNGYAWLNGPTGRWLGLGCVPSVPFHLKYDSATLRGFRQEDSNASGATWESGPGVGDGSRGDYGISEQSDSDSVKFGIVKGTSDVFCGSKAAIATNATTGFLYVPTCAGTPTGTPAGVTGKAPIVINTTNNKLYFYSGGAWRDAGP